MKLFIPPICPLCSRTIRLQKDDHHVHECYNPNGDCFWAATSPDSEESFVSAVLRKKPRLLFVFYEDTFKICVENKRGISIPYGKFKEIDFGSKESLEQVLFYGEKLLLL